MTDVLDEAAAGKGIVPTFQVVVSLPTETPVGCEALARWPSLEGHTTADVFAHAERNATLNLLDRECIRSAVAGALAGGCKAGKLLFINCEPTTVATDLFADRRLTEALESFRLVFELTERGLLSNPRGLLRKVADLRSRGIVIALDDVGAHADSLALLDIVNPDIVKLDLKLVQRQPDWLQTRTVAAIMAYAERTDATILAEGIETEEHLEQALAYGATLGQGYRFGRPGESTIEPGDRPWQGWRTRSSAPAGVTSFDGATVELPSRVVRRRTLLQLSRHIERVAVSAESPPILLATLQQYRNFHGDTRTIYADLAERAPLVVIFGQDVPADPGAGIRGVCLDADDPLALDWTILVLGPDTTAGLIARERDPAPRTGTANNDRRFDTVITFDRARVAAAARSLLDRLPDGSGGGRRDRAPGLLGDRERPGAP
ncbi:putative cyclic di-GMP phosphodiesterase PdeG [Mycolicibacterium vanbaalenii]|uniref:Putative cyclic di-GMP phosphodiesterase PdeG n=1 Tax=Mycolicibacterium vanbaalenii TaxID=110539 RepID=A0A5S9QYW4_MYCVN|nr:EAL domain-containing protein [Mycolicibacterium vanbaalenii]CAA0124737.1 putative cyclic di-GMP phosphodiesterase PdeG [Mycolicibacterium vanbaalenii]